MDRDAGLAALLVAVGAVLAGLTPLIAKWIDSRIEQTRQWRQASQDEAKERQSLSESAADLLERQVKRMEEYADKERARRERAEAALEIARYACPVGQDNCPIKKAAERKDKAEG